MNKLNWAILGPGSIAHQFAEGMKGLDREIYAVGARNLEKGQAFAEQYDIKNVYDDFDKMLADPVVDVVYIATPHSNHYEYIMKSLQNGKHVLAEKAITVSSAELDEISALAKEKGLIVKEAMTIFHMPLYKKLREVVDSGEIGKLKLIQVAFGSAKEKDASNRFYNMDLAGGALLDIGTYALSFARYFLTEAPNEILTTMKKFETGVDEQSGILLKNKEEELAVVSLSFRAKVPKRGIVACEEGFITVDEYPRASRATVTNTTTGKVEEIVAGDTDKALEYEITAMEESISTGENETSELTNDVIAIMTDVRTKWGIKFPFEK
ncbi:Gfo/Idh/MocA family protein [Listeria immobilis]|uniref:Gfo/Idh/MocA family oxidoreductase n=1 Tax=Listeria immobilis TaxID=2713502 RepID=A0ABR6SSM2_9LIST|nr:Gfo/Idh/MocA family oxidoreductase [Listeria immobilis]MBC1483183.1 Gfo/Idh/MocA family oxidoreductase [Listeria immobilis]MBC1505963.1 Gfo/Idh/MocA family oxidoreductase [Listeria immobilis]MBC1508607.1 Gfo/Idh/MocA family oxidoreductase [Listeria immobilis]MBC1516643.1 Gfo/Idh/MocA family oxidoreductase [Listeria immobilis]MBC6303715.1 Gfo/Idh/MocA family oxidoreductase [Listeria immobilis]